MKSVRRSLCIVGMVIGASICSIPAIANLNVDDLLQPVNQCQIDELPVPGFDVPAPTNRFMTVNDRTVYDVGKSGKPSFILVTSIENAALNCVNLSEVGWQSIRF